MASVHKKSKGDFTNFANKYFKKTPFSSYENLKNGLNKITSLKSLEKDVFINYRKNLLATYRSKIMMPKMAFDSDYNKGMRLFVDGLQKMGMNKASDANSTMRFTYGNVLPYDPADAVHYDFYTTLEGVMQKEVITDDKNHEFYVPQRLKDLFESKDYGPYARKEDGKVTGWFFIK